MCRLINDYFFVWFPRSWNFSVRLWNVPVPSLMESYVSSNNGAKVLSLFHSVVIQCLQHFWLSLCLIYMLPGFCAAHSSLCLEKCFLVRLHLPRACSYFLLHYALLVTPFCNSCFQLVFVVSLFHIHLGLLIINGMVIFLLLPELK